jgi:quercetin dioxygenase-like cupin family protein
MMWIFFDMNRTVDLVDKPLHGADGKQVTILHGTFPAGWVGGKHYHSGPVFVYVLEGAFTINEQGKPSQTFTAGQLYEEPIGTPMQVRNIRTSERLKILLFQVNDQGHSLAHKVE